MPTYRNHPLVRQARRFVIGAGMVAGAVVTSGVIAAATAYADTPADVLGEAGQDLAQATTALDGAPTAGLDAQLATFLSGQEALQSGAAETFLSAQETGQAALPAADQAGLATVDGQLAQAFQSVLDADQTFASADQAGDLTGLTGLTDEFGVIEADFSILPADFNVTAADITAELFNALNIPDFLTF